MTGDGIRVVRVRRQLDDQIALVADLTQGGERALEVDTAGAQPPVYPADIVIEAADRTGLLRDITEVLSREKIEERLYGWDEEVGSNAVEVHIHNLRRKLGSGFIRNVRGLGYCVGEAAGSKT